MDAIIVLLEQSSVAGFFRTVRWGYAVLNAAHIAGIAMLVGSILPLDLRLLGLWSDVDVHTLARILIPVAIAGLCLAGVTGLIQFSVRASEYAALNLFQLKLIIIATGVASALTMHYRHGRLLETASQKELMTAGAISMLCWLGALLCGRMIDFVM